ncbi:interferon-induced protein 44-like isoform X2 [Liolophura sinensis]|uniref:interferon-induced protein 44-like isoform X2 n=1 Tax=Liolophura sinensis TaxID=3198878 RepID=UPI0031580670
MGNFADPPAPILINCWRNIDWNTLDALKKNVLGYSTGKDKVPFANIAMFGRVGAGKSSFFNTIDSICKGRFAARFETGESTGSVTKWFRKTRFGGNNGPAFYICDTMGTEENQGLDVTDFPYILDGHLSDKFQFPHCGVTEESSGFVRSPTLGQKMHCLCYIMDSSKVAMISHDARAKIAQIKDLASARNIRFVILLTKIDLLCPEVARDTKNAYQSRAVRKIVEQVSSLTGTPIGFIYLLKNYASEKDLDPAMDALALTALQQMLCFCDDILEELDDE